MEIQSDQVVEAWIEAKVIRADGTVEDLGVLTSYKRPWWRTLRLRIKEKLRWPR